MNDESDRSERLLQLLKDGGPDLIGVLTKEFESLHGEIAQLRREVSALAEYQTARRRWLVLDTPAAGDEAVPGTVVIDPDQMLNVRDGFYPVEFTRTGVPFRWTGPGLPFSFDVFIDRTAGCDLRLEALSCINFALQKNISLFLDGRAVPVQVTQKGSGFTIDAILPPRALNGVSNLTFLLPAVLAPPDSKSPRLLGLAFGKLTVTARGATEAAVSPSLQERR